MGGYNSESVLWSSEKCDIHGRSLQSFIEEPDLIIGNFSAMDSILRSSQQSTLFSCKRLDDPHLLNSLKALQAMKQKWLLNMAN